MILLDKHLSGYGKVGTGERPYVLVLSVTAGKAFSELTAGEYISLLGLLRGKDASDSILSCFYSCKDFKKPIFALVKHILVELF